MTDLKDFFSRWSRRKRGATESSTAKDRVDVERVAAQVGLDRGESGTLGAPPLPIGERAGVRGDRLNERPQPLTPPLSQWEREQTEAADPLPGQTQSPGEVAFDLTQLPS